MPLRNWYNCRTKKFHLTMMVRWKWKTQLDWVIKPVTHDLVWRIRFWRTKSPEQDFKYLYSTISKILFSNLFTCKGTYMIDRVGQFANNNDPTKMIWKKNQCRIQPDVSDAGERWWVFRDSCVESQYGPGKNYSTLYYMTVERTYEWFTKAVCSV